MEINYYVVLDYILKAFLECESKTHILGGPYQYIENEIKPNLIKRFKINSDKHPALYEKLHKDGFTSANNIVTFDGILFVKSGGYKSQQMDISKNRNLQRIQSLFLFLGSLAAIAYFFLEFWKYIQPLK